MIADADSDARLPSVLHIVSGDLWGGAEAVVAELARRQHAAAPGRVACAVMNPGILAEELVKAGIETLVLDESRSSVLKLATSTAKMVRSASPDILHAHRQKENLIALLASRATGSFRHRPRLVTTVHGMTEPVASGRNLRRKLVARANEWVMRTGFDALVGVSNDISNILRQRFPGKRVSCVHNGIRIPPIQGLARPGRSESTLKLLALGRLVPIKRYERLREISEAITACSGERPHITLAGEGPLAADLERVLRAKAPSSGISMRGFVRDTDGLLAECDALVICSDHEGIPMSALEALARGIPVFGFRVGGLPELITPGAPIRLVAPGDSAALAHSIVTYFAEVPPGQRTPPALDWPFDILQCVRSYDSLYLSLLQAG
jgi:glycosyltransferase involved in cell wall biosynthesis